MDYIIQSKNDIQNIDYITESQNINHIIKYSPTKINKPIIQYSNIEKEAPLLYSPTKVLPPIITYETSTCYNPQFNQLKQIPKVKNQSNNNNLDFISKAKSYNIKNIPKINNQNTNYITMKNQENNYINNIINNDNNDSYHYNNNITQDSASSIINQNYLTTIKQLNMNSKPSYQINSYENSLNTNNNIENHFYRNNKTKFDKLGNPIYDVSLDKSLKTKRIYHNNKIDQDNLNNLNINYFPNYYPRSLSQDNFNIDNLKLNEFADYNSRSLSPYKSPQNNLKYKTKINYTLSPITNLHKINPLDIEIEQNSRQIINYYLNMNLNSFTTFSYDSYKLFYPHNDNFTIPENEIAFEIEKTTYLNNNPNLKEKYIGSVNNFRNRHGKGRLFTPTCKRIGTWKNGKFTGWGREIRNNGEVYEGNFNNGKICGKGVYKYKDILYIGDFEKNIRQGKGEKITNKYYYTGDFNNDKIDGFGRLQFINSKDGELEYEGFFKENNIEGKGIMKWKNGNIYEGEMKNNKMNGQGILKLSNGNIINGIFKDGKVCNKNINNKL